MAFEPPEQFNIADYFLDARVQEGKGERPAVLTAGAAFTYREIEALANQFGHVLREAGVQPEQRVMIALPDGPAFVAALFGALKIGAVVVMVNPQLKPDAIAYFYRYTRARVIVAHRDTVGAFRAAARGARHLRTTCVVGEEEWDARLAHAPAALDTFPTHRDDAAIWLFSGGTTGQPKAVVQTHRSFANTTECYAKGVIGYTERDVTLSVPKLYFGYATGSNLLFPFSVGAATVLFPEAATADVLFQKITQFRPTILINVPTMINQMVSHPTAATRDLSCLRLATSAGEPLPVELYHRWKDTFGVERARACASPLRRASRSRSSCITAGRTRSGSSSWTVSVRRRCGTSSSRTVRDSCDPERSVPSFRALRSKSATPMGGSCRTARWAACGCAATRARSATGSKWTRPGRRSGESGTCPVT